jgi:hypothetical protein
MESSGHLLRGDTVRRDYSPFAPLGVIEIAYRRETSQPGQIGKSAPAARASRTTGQKARQRRALFREIFFLERFVNVRPRRDPLGLGPDPRQLTRIELHEIRIGKPPARLQLERARRRS